MRHGKDLLPGPLPVLLLEQAVGHFLAAPPQHGLHFHEVQLRPPVRSVVDPPDGHHAVVVPRVDEAVFSRGHARVTERFEQRVVPGVGQGVQVLFAPGGSPLVIRPVGFVGAPQLDELLALTLARIRVVAGLGEDFLGEAVVEVAGGEVVVYVLEVGVHGLGWGRRPKLNTTANYLV